ncbi:MAG: DUF4058 family protein [Planctomycetes bacterium]|nr:DUF4058 family protein [Planctomycetota bacterium]
MPCPFPGMDPFLEIDPIFRELHIQMLAAAQAQLQPQLRPRYVARLERHLSEGGVWELEVGAGSLEGKEPDLVIAGGTPRERAKASTAILARPSASCTEELSQEELALRKQRRIVIYVRAKPRIAVATIELLSPSNKERGTVGQARYLEKRASALRSGTHWIEIDLLRAGERPFVPVHPTAPADYEAYVAQATPSGWNHLAYGWGLRDALPSLAIPLLGRDQAILDLGAAFLKVYDVIAADDEAAYDGDPPGPPLSDADRAWADALLREKGLRG